MEKGAPPSILATAPPDGKFDRIAAWMAYFVLGCGMLAPFNALISAADYMETMWPGRHVDRLLTVCYLPTCLVFLLLNMKLSSWARLRLLSSYGGFVIGLCLVPIVDLTMVGHDPSAGAPESALSVVLAVAVWVGMWDGIGQGALYGDASLLPPEYTHAVVGGTAVAGTAICVLRAITKAGAGETLRGLRISSNAYFFSCAAIAAFCIILYGWVMPHMPVVKYWRARKVEEGKTALPHILHTAPSRRNSAAAPGGKDAAPGSPRAAACGLPPLPDDAPAPKDAIALPQGGLPVLGGGAGGVADTPFRAPSRAGSLSRSGSLVERAGSALPALARQLSVPLSPPTLPQPTLLDIWRLRWQVICAIFMIYVVTLAIFPGFLAEDVSSGHLGSWYPVILFLCFNIADLAGKLFPLFSWNPSQLLLLILTSSRVVFFPAFYCAARFAAPPYVTGALTLLLGFSNGYLTAHCFNTSQKGLTPIENDLTANFMVVGLVSGLNAGAYLGFLWLLAH